MTIVMAKSLFTERISWFIISFKSFLMSLRISRSLFISRTELSKYSKMRNFFSARLVKLTILILLSSVKVRVNLVMVTKIAINWVNVDEMKNIRISQCIANVLQDDGEPDKVSAVPDPVHFFSQVTHKCFRLFTFIIIIHFLNNNNDNKKVTNKCFRLFKCIRTRKSAVTFSQVHIRLGCWYRKYTLTN